MKRKVCMYPLCPNFDPRAGIYCCDACSEYHYDYTKLHNEDKDITSFKMTVCLKAAEKIIPPNSEVKGMWFRSLASMRAAIRIQKINDLNTMVVCLTAAEKIVPLDLEIRRVWSKSLAAMREAVKLQKEE